MVLKKHSALTNTLLRQWQTGGWLSNLLLPLSWFTRLVVSAKSWLYTHGLKKQNRLPVPVIVVGNIFVGGTGKTPFVLALIAALRERGWQPGVVSRGYGVDIGQVPRYGSGEHVPAELLGDEPAMLARAAPVAVHPNRTLAARCLLQHNPDITVIIADDGLQHLALGRDIEIALQDNRGTGNGRLLPAGPLREPASRLAEVDYLVVNAPADDAVNKENVTSEPATGQNLNQGVPVSPNLQETKDRNTRARKTRCVIMQLYPTRIVHLLSGRALAPAEWLAGHQGQSIAAVAGIGHPPRFFRTLEHAGIAVQQTFAFPDHYAYRPDAFSTIATDVILMTAKDAAKCLTMQDNRLWSVEVAPRFSDADFFDDIAQKLKSIPLY